jgi:S1-C subfamily serine protease
MGIRWELLNRRTNQVVYKLLSRFSTSGGTPEQLGEKLALGAFYSLLARPKFSEAMRVDETAEQEQESYTQAKFKSCRTQRLEMPARAEDALKATVLVEAGGGLGSGALISPDGLILTAAHVVRDADVITVQFRGGEQAEARLVRINTHSDVALLKAETTSETACVPLRTDAMRVGDEVYAIGSPLSKELSFTLTRGIVSADREIEGVKLLQTDASVNPGNSGGPLLDKQGRWAALVSWKVVGRGVQGIAFGVPTQTTIQALGLTASDQTEQVLTRQMAHTAAASGNDGVEDTPDPVIPLTDRRTMDSPRETDPITDRNFDRPTKPKETETDAGMLVVGIGLLATASGVLY